MTISCYDWSLASLSIARANPYWLYEVAIREDLSVHRLYWSLRTGQRMPGDLKDFTYQSNWLQSHSSTPWHTDMLTHTHRCRNTQYGTWWKVNWVILLSTINLCTFTVEICGEKNLLQHISLVNLSTRNDQREFIPLCNF